MWQYFLKSRIPNKKENELPQNSRIQETDPPGFTSIRHVTFCMCKLSNSLFSIRLQNFFEIDSFFIYFGDGRNNLVFLIGNIRLWTLINWGVVSGCLRIWIQQCVSQQQSKHSATPPRNRFWLGHVTTATRVFLPTTREAVDREPEEGLLSVLH